MLLLLESTTMTDYEKYTKQYFNEIFLLNSLYTKLVAFLEDKEQCKTAGYNYYESYHWHSSNTTSKTYIIDANAYIKDASDCKNIYDREGIRLDVLSHDYLHHFYSISVSFRGDRHLNYLRKFIADNCMDIYVDDDISQIMDPSTNSYIAFRTNFLTSNKDAGVRPGATFNPLDIMKYIITRITPSYAVGLINIERIKVFFDHSDEFHINKFDLDKVMKFKSLIDAIITGKINLPY